MRSVVRVIFATGLVALQCVQSGAAGTGPDVLVFPVPAGWTVQSDSMTYGPDNLWEYIDGAADLFVSYGFKRLQCATYRTHAGAEVRAEAYRHASATQAYGMYSQERSPENAPVNIGIEGCADEGMVNVVLGNWYLKLSGSLPATKGDLLIVAKVIDSVLGSPRGLPEGFSLLPSDRRVQRSEQYIARDFLGYGFLTNVFLARYGDGDGCQMFVVRTASPEAAHAALESFRRKATTSGPGVSSSITHIVDPHHGPVDVAIHGSDLFGVLGCGINDSSYHSLLKNLQ
jgi:hypothetical protein